MSTTSHKETLQNDYPWTTSPLIAAAPMRLIAKSALVLAVSRAGGIGFLGAGTDISDLASDVSEIQKSLASDPIPNTPPNILPIGIGFILWGLDLAHVTKTLSQLPLPPAAIWLFAPHSPSDLPHWTASIRKATSNLTKIWIQVGTVSSAVSTAQTCSPDVLIIQSSDAGGHGLAQSSSLISLLPECADALQAAGYGGIPLIAAGGIVEARSAAAAVMLGASGICMGTRFLACPEAVITQGYRNAVLAASDGGVTTARTSLYDQLRGTTGWPGIYNGRGVLNKSWWDEKEGLGIEENRKLYEAEMKKGDEGWGVQGRMTTYAGTGVGLIRKVMPAGEVVVEVREGAKKLLKNGGSRL
ncbi:2-nitropropane dioxygenase protein [Rutstroemia sp. NJR-2017a WRK4]|nr:2-nitropropane dioxygenase protein [Rutstroemia sp. NJR-2017a WRK4]